MRKIGEKSFWVRRKAYHFDFQEKAENEKKKIWREEKL